MTINDQHYDQSSAGDQGQQSGVSPDVVLELSAPTDSFLIGLNQAEYQIDFIGFKIRDYNSGQTLFEINKTEEQQENFTGERPAQQQIVPDDSARTIRYDFGSDFLELNTIGTTLTFNVGQKDVRNFRMIESHYFQWPSGEWERIKSYDFSFPFCPHNTHNTWEVVYDMPDFRPELKQAIIDNPWRTQSDSFYFVEDLLIMQNKALYSYQHHQYEDGGGIQHYQPGEYEQQQHYSDSHPYQQSFEDHPYQGSNTREQEGNY